MRVVIWILGALIVLSLLFTALFLSSYNDIFPENISTFAKIVFVFAAILIGVMIKYIKSLAGVSKNVSIFRNILRVVAALVIVGFLIIIFSGSSFGVIILSIVAILYIAYMVTFPKIYFRPA